MGTGVISGAQVRSRSRHPRAARRAVVGAPTQDDCTRVQILELVGVLPDVAHHVAHAKRRIASRGMRCSRLWTVVDLARRHRWVPLHVILALAPGIEPLIVPLRGVLPLPLVG